MTGEIRRYLSWSRMQAPKFHRIGDKKMTTAYPAYDAPPEVALTWIDPCPEPVQGETSRSLSAALVGRHPGEWESRADANSARFVAD